MAEANVQFTGAEIKNKLDDNAKQLAVAIDKHYQEWADLHIKAAKEEVQKMPPKPEFDHIIQVARQILNGGNQ